MNESLLFIGILILCFSGIIGSIIPGIPGVPLPYIAMWIMQWNYKIYSDTFLIGWTLIVLLSLIIDYFLPVFVAKKFGASTYGVWGSVIGMIIGIFFTPIGMMLGMLLGAIIGELLAGNSNEKALKAGIATFIGTLITIGISVGITFMLSIYVIIDAYKLLI